MFPQLKKPDRLFRIGLITGIISSGLIFLLFSVVTNYNSLSDCELHFIQSIGVSKKAYRRIQDGNRILTADELTQLATTIPTGTLERNIVKVWSAHDLTYKACIKDALIPNLIEEKYIKEELRVLSRKQTRSDSINQFMKSRLIVTIDSLDKIISKDAKNFGVSYSHVEVEGLISEYNDLIDHCYTFNEKPHELDNFWLASYSETVRIKARKSYSIDALKKEVERLKDNLRINNYWEMKRRQVAALRRILKERQDSLSSPQIWDKGIAQIPFNKDYVSSIIESEKIYP